MCQFGTSPQISSLKCGRSQVHCMCSRRKVCGLRWKMPITTPSTYLLALFWQEILHSKVRTKTQHNPRCCALSLSLFLGFFFVKLYDLSLHISISIQNTKNPWNSVYIFQMFVLNVCIFVSNMIYDCNELRDTFWPGISWCGGRGASSSRDRRVEIHSSGFPLGKGQGSATTKGIGGRFKMMDQWSMDDVFFFVSEDLLLDYFGDCFVVKVEGTKPKPGNKKNKSRGRESPAWVL